MQNFRALGALPPDPQNSPPLRISGYPPGYVVIFRQLLYPDNLFSVSLD